MKFWPWLVAIVAALAVVFLVLGNREKPPEPVADQPSPTARISAEEPAQQAPAPEPAPVPPPAMEAPEPSEPLPPLDDSDAEIRQEAEAVAGGPAINPYISAPGIARKLVVTVDNLPRDKVAMRLRAVPELPGRFAASGSEDDLVLDESNFVRYQPFVDLVASLDAVQVADAYRHFYPLLQEAYEDLGYPGQPFHYRVIECIDDLLDAPEVGAGVRLVRPKILYEFADPALEARSAGQKALIRMGPDNARIVKAKLREIRAALAAPAAQG